MKSYNLSIETAFEGGSLAIFSPEGLVVEWEGSGKLSKAEDVLEQLSALLENSGISKQTIKTILVSSKSGSSTGAKIGQAIAKGLGHSLNCQVVDVSIFDGLLKSLKERTAGEYLILIPAGNSRFNIQVCEIKKDGLIKELSLPKIQSEAVVFELMNVEKSLNVIIAGNFDLFVFEGMHNKIFDMTSHTLAYYLENQHRV